MDFLEYKRHPLSAMFGDLDEESYQDLKYSVEKTGFMDPSITLFEGQILDGWHRYKVACELEELDELEFFEHEGSVSALNYVLNVNLHRRHLTASQRAQIVVEANEWMSNGGDRKSSTFSVPNGTLKTKSELADMAGVGERTISRAKEVSRAGRSDEVISGERSASAVIAEEKAQQRAADAEVVVDEALVKHFLQVRNEVETAVAYCNRPESSNFYKEMISVEVQETAQCSESLQIYHETLKVLIRDGERLITSITKRWNTADADADAYMRKHQDLTLEGLKRIWKKHFTEDK